MKSCLIELKTYWIEKLLELFEENIEFSIPREIVELIFEYDDLYQVVLSCSKPNKNLKINIDNIWACFSRKLVESGNIMINYDKHYKCMSIISDKDWSWSITKIEYRDPKLFLHTPTHT